MIFQSNSCQSNKLSLFRDMGTATYLNKPTYCCLMDSCGLSNRFTKQPKPWLHVSFIMKCKVYLHFAKNLGRERWPTETADGPGLVSVGPGRAKHGQIDYLLLATYWRLIRLSFWNNCQLFLNFWVQNSRLQWCKARKGKRIPRRRNNQVRYLVIFPDVKIGILIFNRKKNCIK